MLTHDGNPMVTEVDSHYLVNHRRHVDQIQLNTSGESKNMSTVISSTNTIDLDTESQSELNGVPGKLNVAGDCILRRSESARSMPSRDDRHPEYNSTYGECDTHERLRCLLSKLLFYFCLLILFNPECLFYEFNALLFILCSYCHCILDSRDSCTPVRTASKFLSSSGRSMLEKDPFIFIQKQRYPFRFLGRFFFTIFSPKFLTNSQ